jgi:hypothetical protein
MEAGKNIISADFAAIIVIPTERYALRNKKKETYFTLCAEKKRRIQTVTFRGPE